MDVMDDSHLGRSQYEAPQALLEMEDEYAEPVRPSQLRRARRTRWTEPVLNITSFVDVLSVLLFFLLSVATMEKLGAHDVNLPQQTQDFTKE
ncbi:MAG: Biopolymer transport protein ExbD/TolR, partial [Candidatus Binatota bacterium]|nr:Biopolymer transport protein ExbD/TolR [Candidatus Binatota bacterium]